ncbi:hypothetical protein [Rhodopseudomonas palustris]|uniref:DUF2784 domain-containing protein n=1 Tax=Rhodopseudomonas palustris (strain BisB18) TaxID=316056 RepID=Q213Y4_RHOPB
MTHHHHRANAPSPAQALTAIKALHTTVWAVFALSILAIPLLTLSGQLAIALWTSLFVWIEVIVLAGNRMRCPLTAIAARYTPDRAANFDIYLPLWLASSNKLIFGTLFAASQVLLLWQFTRPA